MNLDSPARQRPDTATMLAKTKDNSSILAALKSVATDAGAKSESRPLHSFPARMPVTVAKLLLEGTCCDDSVVVDPMVGSGTTLRAARELGLACTGFDIDPLAVLISRVITREYHPDEVRAAHSQVLTDAEELVRSRPSLVNDYRLSAEERTFLDFWFPPENQLELSALACSIGRLEDDSIRELMWVLFSTLIIAKSAGVSFALDLSHTRPHKRESKTMDRPFKAWNSRIHRALALCAHSASNGRQPSVLLGDARSLECRDRYCDVILTSPPYLSAIDYMRCHKFSLIWMRHDLQVLRRIRSEMIGAQIGLYCRDGIPERLEKDLGEYVSDTRKRATIRRYLSDINRSIVEMARILRPGGVVLLAAGPNFLTRRRYDAVEVFSQLLEAANLEVLGHVTRRIADHQRALPPPRWSNPGNDLNKRMRSEVFIAARKER